MEKRKIYALPPVLFFVISASPPPPTSSPMKGSRQNSLSCLSWWPYYLPLWTLVLTPLAASRINFLFFCFQASHNSYPSQAGSLSFSPTPISFCSDTAATRTLLYPSHPALSPWPRQQVPRLCCHWLYPFIRSLAVFLHRQRKKDFFFSPCFLPCAD